MTGGQSQHALNDGGMRFWVGGLIGTWPTIAIAGGIAAPVIAAANHRAHIPMAAGVDSLNVAAADAFVAASLSQFSLTSRLVFLVVGPMVDLKLIAMQTGVFGRRFAVRFAPTTFAAAVLVATAVGAVLL